MATIPENFYVFGDSHTVFLGAPELDVFSSKLPELSIREYCNQKNGISSILYGKYCHLGPRLAYTFDPFIIEEFIDKQNMQNFEVGSIVYFYLGEIDIRCHLVKHKNSMEVANQYFERTLEWANRNRVSPRWILPPPPGDFGFRDSNYPKLGTIIQRALAHKRFCETLIYLCRGHAIETPIFLKKQYLLNRFPSHILNSKYSDDGCHYNSQANVKLENRIVKLAALAQR